MVLTLTTFACVALIGYVWLLRGFFSALINLMCILAAGAIAFAVWEPLAHLLLNKAPDRGILAFVGDMAWGLALGVPFGVSAALLRLLVDGLLPANAQAGKVGDAVGGALCGVAAGVICLGMFSMSVGFLRTKSDFLGYKPVTYSQSADGPGSLVRTREAFIPWADRLTARLYERLSLTSFRSGAPLAKYYPNLEDVPATMRLTYEDKNRNTVRRNDLRLLDSYVVGDPNKPQSFNALAVDMWDTKAQRFTDIEGQPFTQGYLAGYAVQFRSGAKERKVGQVAIGAGQVRLLVESTTQDDWKNVFPIAAVTRTDNPAVLEFRRSRFNANDVYFAGVGGASETTMAFEFPVPAGYRPVALYVKNVRFDIEGQRPAKEFPTPAARDAAVITRQLWDASSEFIDENAAPTGDGPPPADPIRVARVLPRSIGLQKGSEKALSIVEDQSRARAGYEITDGQQRYARAELKSSQMVERSLQIHAFAETRDTVVVQVDVSIGSRVSPMGEAYVATEKNRSAYLIDNNGTRYEAIGYVYEDRSEVWIRYTPGTPMRSLEEVPQLSQSRTDQALVLLFRVSKGVQIVEVKVGDTTIFEPKPPIDTVGNR